jgi:hypothetical protein
MPMNYPKTVLVWAAVALVGQVAPAWSLAFLCDEKSRVGYALSEGRWKLTEFPLREINLLKARPDDPDADLCRKSLRPDIEGGQTGNSFDFECFVIGGLKSVPTYASCAITKLPTGEVKRVDCDDYDFEISLIPAGTMLTISKALAPDFTLNPLAVSVGSCMTVE